jgi:hypothetical protein
VLSSLSVALGTGKSTFSAAVDKTGRIYVEGAVRNDTPYLTKIGGFDVELSVSGSVLLCRQRDQPGIVGNVGMALAKGNINISFMTVCRTTRNEEAIMAIGIDDEPTQEVRRARGGGGGVAFWEGARVLLRARGDSQRRAASPHPLCAPNTHTHATQVLAEIGKVQGVVELAVFKELQL